MKLIVWILALVAVIVLTSWVCYRIAFAPSGKKAASRPLFPNNPQFEPYREQMKQDREYMESLPWEPWEIVSHDGLTLKGRFYRAENEKGLLLLVHGYRSGRRDFSSAVPFYLQQGYSLLLIDQRSSGDSQGRAITFGAKERLDCQAWAWEAAKRRPELPLALDGISMGATTVLLASALPMPEQLRCIIADSGFTTPAAIVKKVMRQMKLPLFPLYFLTRMGGIIFAGFDLNSYSVPEALASCRWPVLMAHGEADHFVPCEMSHLNYAACPEPKTLVTVAGAGHGLSYLVDMERLQGELKDFLDRYMV